MNKTKHLNEYITKPQKTKYFDFVLKEDNDFSLLSDKMRRVPLKISRNGTVRWESVIRVNLKCEIRAVRFPNDEQLCALKWRLVPERKDVNVSIECEANKTDVKNNQWKLMEFTMRKDVCYLVLSRRSEKIWATLGIPFILFNVLICLVYFLPPSSGERVGYSVTLVLSFSLLVMAIDKMVPSSDNENAPSPAG